jgi:hypothetical protein
MRASQRSLALPGETRSTSKINGFAGHLAIKSWHNNPLRIAALNFANRGVVGATEYFALMGPVSVRFGSVDALARVSLVLFARPVLQHLVRAGATEPGVEHLPRPPMPGID